MIDPTAHHLWDEFLTVWPMDRLRNLSLPEYSAVGNQDTFTYWLEAKTDSFGSIWGGSAFKFGVFSRKDETLKSNGGGLSYTDKYGWYTKYGDTPEAAFEAVKQMILRIVDAADRQDLEAVDSVEFSPVVKWKIAFFYQGRFHPSILPVYKRIRLQSYAKSRGLPSEGNQAQLYRVICESAPTQDVLELGAECLKVSEALIEGQQLTADAAEAFLNARYGYRVPPTQYIAAFETPSGKQLAILRGQAKARLFLQPPLPVLEGLGDAAEYPPGRARNSNLSSQAPQLSKQSFAINVSVPNLALLEELCELYELPEAGTPMLEEVSDVQTAKTLRSVPLNLILYGPPGTGKTYSTVSKALEAADPEFLALHRANRKALTTRFNELQLLGQIRFVTFHQSFSYEDFVEGIRATRDDRGQLIYKVEDGVFKQLCKFAGMATEGVPDGTSALGRYSRVFRSGQVISRDYEVLEVTPEVVYLKKPNGKTLPLTWKMLAELAEAVKNKLITYEDIKEKRALDKMPDSTLEPYLVHGYQNILPRIIEEMITAEEAPTKQLRPDTALVLIIDEINRGNISRIFGELITLLEPSRRSGSIDALAVQLPYSRETFSVPSNLYIIGTMNTADRSVAGLDIALRRRFVFEEMQPDPAQLNGIEVDAVPIDELLAVLNERIEALRDLDHCIGHSYFLPLREDPSLTRLASIFRGQILPLLQEFFFDDWERISWVLNDHAKESPELHFVVAPRRNLAALFGQNIADSLEEKRWRVNSAAFDRIESYRGILKA